MSTPPPVPPVADAPRVQTYTVISSTAAIDLQFPVYGDGGDLEVWVNNAKLDQSLWTFVSKSGVSVSIITQPITDGQIQFSPVLTTGVVIIDGNWRPRRVAQPTSPGVTRRELNQTVSNIISSQREQYDGVGRSLRAIPGETMLPLPNAATRKNGGSGSILGFSGATGDPVVLTGSGTGSVNTLAPVSAGDIPEFFDNTGTIIRRSVRATHILNPSRRTVVSGAVVVSATTDDIVIIAYTSPAAVNVNFPTVAARIAAGLGRIGIKNGHANAALYPITPVRSGSDTIDGTASPLPQDNGRVVWYEPIAATNDWEIQ